MNYIKCNACPSQADCDEAGKCLNTLVTHSYLRHKDGSVAGVIKAEPLMCGRDYSGAPTPAPAQPQAARQPRAEGAPSRPAAGTTTGRVWAIADQQLAQWPHGINKEFRRLVISACEAAGINSSTASVQYGKWLSSRT